MVQKIVTENPVVAVVAVAVVIGLLFAYMAGYASGN